MKHAHNENAGMLIMFSMFTILVYGVSMLTLAKKHKTQSTAEDDGNCAGFAIELLT